MSTILDTFQTNFSKPRAVCVIMRNVPLPDPVIDALALDATEVEELLVKRRWPDGVVCPHCGGRSIGKLGPGKHRPGLFKCYADGCMRQFTVRSATIMHWSHFTLNQWLAAATMRRLQANLTAAMLQQALHIHSHTAALHLLHKLAQAPPWLFR